ncbi:MAG: endonuclease domain-containing protein [Gammaproteobacteria bacterium]|jgi:hypothetical protein|nr:endonuclease domain-containing protein [Gammaproteobacteria bacterium]
MPAPDAGLRGAGLDRWRREDSERFEFGERRFDPASGRIELEFRLDGIELVERFRLPVAEGSSCCPEAVDAALDLLHWTAGISYWKAGCPTSIGFARRVPDAWQARWLDRLYREGLAEFAWRNGLEPVAADWPADGTGNAAVSCGLPRRSLVPMGGGKDSLVALERLRRAGEAPDTVQVGQAALIRRVAEAAGTRHLVVERQVDGNLAELNRRGAWNGHVPITAINASALILLALVHGYDRVVFANERSADEATLHDERGRPVNHQFSKSLIFEAMLAEWVARCITPDLAVFSILRRDRELAVCREFAGLERYHGVFSSCNRNFHLDGARTVRWCGRCPKCHFVFLAMAPFLSPAKLEAIFGANLLDDRDQLDGFRELLAIDGAKPFECVGEAGEARAALAALAVDPRWRACRVVTALSPLLERVDVPDLQSLCRPGRAHHIPDALIAHA